jgi:ferric-dicitrate binding protein FerR (iron transport regulator)
MRANSRTFLSAAVASFALLAAGPALPQSASLGCTAESVAGTGRQVLHCPKGVTVEVEDGAAYSLIDRNQDGDADGVRLRRKALLLDAPSGMSRPGFVVVTPQAIAAVRGTRWAVDAQGGKTSVFVVNGVVGVQRPSASAGVSLRRGEGVDVEPGSGPLTVRRWPQPRVAALLARFGQ